MFSNDLAIDLGTANTIVYAKGRGVVCNEPSVVAIQNNSAGTHYGSPHARFGSSGRQAKKVIAVGTDAKNMIGKAPDKVTALRPLKGGTISDFQITQEMLRHLLKKAATNSSWLVGLSLIKPRVVISVNPAITEVEKRAIKEATFAAGAREVFLLPEPLVAGIGAGLPVTEATGVMIVDIGGGSAEVSMICMKGIVYSRSIQVGGDKMDEALTSYVKRKYNVLLGERSAEQAKIDIGSAMIINDDSNDANQNNGVSYTEASGRDLVLGVPKIIQLSEYDTVEALSECTYQIAELIRTALEKIPPELSGDILERGIFLTGGSSLLRNLDKFLEQKIGIKVTVVDKPTEAVAIGSGMVLDDYELLNEIKIG